MKPCTSTDHTAGWEALFGSVADQDDDFSDTASQRSLGSVRSKRTTGTSAIKKPQAPPKDVRPVSKLRPKMPVIMSHEDSIAEVAAAMTRER